MVDAKRKGLLEFEILNNTIGWVRTPYDAALVSVVALHVEVAVVCDGEDVRRHFSDLLVGVEADLVCRVDGQQLIRVHSH